MKTNRKPAPRAQQRPGLIEQELEPSSAARRWPLGFVALCALAATNLANVSARPQNDPFPDFIPMPGLSAEGVVVDQRGNVFVSVRGADQTVWKYSPSGDASLVTTLNGGTIGGLAIAENGTLYVAMAEGAGRGVYVIGRRGVASRLPGTEQIVFANALAFDQRGTLYVSESYSLDGAGYGQGGIWRIRPGKSAQLWLRDELLSGGGGVFPYPVGANGIACYHGDLYVANTDKALIVRVPIRPNGQPGDATVWAQLEEVVPTPPPFPLFADGIEIDEHGNVYVAVVSRNAVVRINRETMEQDTIALLAPVPGHPNAPLDTPASLALGPRKGGERDLFVTNLGIMSAFMPGSTWPGAGLVKVDAEIQTIKGSLLGTVWWAPWTDGSCACESGVVAITAASGELSHLEATDALFSHCAPAPTNPDVKFLCTQATFVSAKGDELWATYDTEHYTGGPLAGPLVLTFTGGTGRFKHANGTALMSWQVVPVFNETGMDLSVPWAWSATIDGTIYYGPCRADDHHGSKSGCH